MEFKDTLKNERLKKEMSIRGLARLSNVSHPYISQLESGNSKQPTKNRLLAISYALDPTGSDNVYERLVKSTTLESDNPNKEFDEYIKAKNFDIDLSKISTKVLINKKEKTVTELDAPFVDIEWLLSQDTYEIYLGHWSDNFVTDEKGYSVPDVFLLNDQEKKIMKELVEVQKDVFIKERNKDNEDMDNEENLKNAKKFLLLEDLLKGRISDKKQLIENLLDISRDYSKVLSEEYIDAILTATAHDNAKELLDLLNTTDLENFKKYLEG